jgi:hypothetical protein
MPNGTAHHVPRLKSNNRINCAAIKTQQPAAVIAAMIAPVLMADA